MAEENLRKCFVVIDSSYDVGLSAYAFWGQEDAKKVFMADLKKEGYERIEVLEKMDSMTVYVPDTDIYYAVRHRNGRWRTNTRRRRRKPSCGISCFRRAEPGG